jgi:hypothetical protein
MQLDGGDRGVVGQVPGPAVHAAGPQRAQQALGHVGVVDQVEPLVGRPAPGPHERLTQVRVALAVDERQPRPPQAEAVGPVQLPQRVLGRRLARRVGSHGRQERVVLAGGASPAGAVDQVGAGQHEPADAGVHGGACQRDGGGPVDGDRLLVGDPAERGGQMDDRVDAVHGAPPAVRVAQIAGDDPGAAPAQRLAAPGVAHQHDDLLALLQQPRDEPAADAPGGAGHERSHSNLPGVGYH